MICKGGEESDIIITIIITPTATITSRSYLPHSQPETSALPGLIQPWPPVCVYNRAQLGK